MNLSKDAKFLFWLVLIFFIYASIDAIYLKKGSSSALTLLILCICYLQILINEGKTKTAALEVRLEALEAELKELKAKQTNAGTIGNDPV